jgi:putative transposase
MRKENFYPGNLYHIYNRGIEKRTIFQSPTDYKRFLLYLELLNDEKIGLTLIYRNARLINKNTRAIIESLKSKPIIDILCYCLMPNHFHLILSPKTEQGISNFMHKLGTAFGRFFNEKYNRTGRLFEGPFKAKLIDNKSYFFYLTLYLHVINPEELQPNSYAQYPWSSYSSYASGNQSDHILNFPLVKKLIQVGKPYRKMIEGEIKKEQFLKQIKHLTLENNKS